MGEVVSHAASAETLRAAILELLAARKPGATICPSEAARLAFPERWRECMEGVRDVARALAEEGMIEIRQRGKVVSPHGPLRGPIRLAPRGGSKEGLEKGEATSDEPAFAPVQFAIAAALTGVIWMVQCVTYPQFLAISPSDFPAFHARYTSAIAYIVGPLMIAELALAGSSVWQSRRSRFRFQVGFAALLVVGLWGTTFFVQVPQHDLLSQGKSEETVRDLVAGNWIRTVLWSVRCLWLFALITTMKSEE